MRTVLIFRSLEPALRVLRRSETAAPVYALESTMTITLEMQTEVFLGFSGRGFHGLPVMSIRRADAAVTVRRMVSILLIPLYDQAPHPTPFGHD